MNDTIVAIATPVGESSIGVVRISGKEAIKILTKIFDSRRFKKARLDSKSPQVFFGKIVDEDVIDEVVITVFKAPYSYNGEDIVEISAHGNPFILKMILELALRNGARLAKPGEFTMRAYLNGKIDLIKAESVNDLIKAHTKFSHLTSIAVLTGKLSQKLNEIDESIIEVLSLLEAAIDHSDLYETYISPEKLREYLISLRRKIKELLSTSKAGIISSKGLRVAIVGSPNAGKSSIMNALLNEDRVIVSELPGTTRDVIIDEISISGILVRLFDTAGLHNTDDFLEKKGMEKTRKIIEEADLIMFVVDASREFSESDREIFESIRTRDFFTVVNKIDLPCKVDIEKVEKLTKRKVIKISALNKPDIAKIEEEIEKFYFSLGHSPENEVLVVNTRQESLLCKALEFTEKAILSFEKGLSEEFIASDLRKAKNYIEEITGISKDEAILDKIFSKFCIGK